MSYLYDQIALAIRKFSNQIDQLREAIKQHADSRNEADKTAPILRAELQIPERVYEYQSTKDRKQNRLEWYKFWVEVLTLFAVIWYASVATWQLGEMRKTTAEATRAADAATRNADTASKQLDASQKLFEINQRPYVIVETPVFTTMPPTPDDNSVRIVLRNIGLTPAIRVRREIKAFRNRPTARTPKNMDAWVKFLFGQFDALEHNLDLGEHEKYSSIAREDIAPKAFTFNSPVADPPLDAKELQELGTNAPLDVGHLGLWVIGVTRYMDAYGNRYETRFCDFQFGDPHVWHVCDSNNTIK